MDRKAVAGARHVEDELGDLALADVRRTQIVKFHGDFADDESLVLTETDYFSRLSLDSPLNVKFRADAMGRTVLFM